MKVLERKLSELLSRDIGLLVLRVSVGILMLFHGVAKLSYGIEGIKQGLVSSGLPSVLSYGVYIGEVVAPILLIVGLLTRISALLIMGTMCFAIFIAHSHELFVLNKFGAPIIELPLLYLLISFAVCCMGAGKYSLDKQ